MLWLSGAKWFAQDRTVGVASIIDAWGNTAPTVSAEQYNRCERLHLRTRCLEVDRSTAESGQIRKVHRFKFVDPQSTRSEI